MTSRKNQIITVLERASSSLDASDIAAALGLDRSNVSRYLNELYKEKKIDKIDGRPVLYHIPKSLQVDPELISFANLVGKDESLVTPIKQAKAAMMYPPRGLHTIIFGQSGTGKSMFAECMYEYGLTSHSLAKTAPFISFNCADYAQNPQLLFSHIFGVKKGAFTGADDDKKGLISKADGGVLFLDEIHRLPPEGQEMLFTFIDKGTYRPLGESSETHSASVQIIGATTESDDVFLTTFKRRIPMSITLPPLSERSLDERYDIVSLFLSQESNRLNNRIEIDKEVMLAFMLYDTEGNIGQVKRDLKLVCAKAFLNYRTINSTHLVITVSDLPLAVKKGLLRIKEVTEKLDRFFDMKLNYLTFDPGMSHVVWQKDDTQSMEVYSTIEEMTSLSDEKAASVDLEALIDSNFNQYFEVYVDELTRKDIHQELVSKDIWDLTDRLYQVAEEKLNRKFNEMTRFAFALHLQSTIERIKQNQPITHPNLNDVRKKYLAEFQVAIELSGMIEEETGIDLPFDEIGFLTMFLNLDISEITPNKHTSQVSVLLLMHGKSTATSMLEAAQDLLGSDVGVAFNMPLTMEVTDMYDKVKRFVLDNKDNLDSGALILTDMGSLNTFGHMLTEETGVVTKTMSLVSTMVVLEAVRMASIGRSLKEIYINLKSSFESAVQSQFKPVVDLPKAVVVACFTGEGVAKKLYERVAPSMLEKQVKVIQMQFLERSSFKARIDELSDEYSIQAIVGTVDIDYYKTPFFTAYEIFEDDTLEKLESLVSDQVSLKELSRSLKSGLVNTKDSQSLLEKVKEVTEKVEKDLSVYLDPGIQVGLILHVTFLVDRLLGGGRSRIFNDLENFKKNYRYEMDIVQMNMKKLEKAYEVSVSEDEIAYLTEMYVMNQTE